jgi:hypothetical protein
MTYRTRCRRGKTRPPRRRGWTSCGVLRRSSGIPSSRSRHFSSPARKRSREARAPHRDTSRARASHCRFADGRRYRVLHERCQPQQDDRQDDARLDAIRARADDAARRVREADEAEHGALLRARTRRLERQDARRNGARRARRDRSAGGVCAAVERGIGADDRHRRRARSPDGGERSRGLSKPVRSPCVHQREWLLHEGQRVGLDEDDLAARARGACHLDVERNSSSTITPACSSRPRRGTRRTTSRRTAPASASLPRRRSSCPSAGRA